MVQYVNIKLICDDGRIVVSLFGSDLKMSDSESKISVNFVLAVLRQHELEFDRLIAELELLVDKVSQLSDKLKNRII